MHVLESSDKYDGASEILNMNDANPVMIPSNITTGKRHFSGGYKYFISLNIAFKYLGFSNKNIICAYANIIKFFTNNRAWYFSTEIIFIINLNNTKSI